MDIVASIFLFINFFDQEMNEKREIKQTYYSNIFS